jgi:hypothetical protein
LGGYCVIDVVGVWCWGWRLWKETGEPLDDWQLIIPSLRGRVVYICFDSDAVEKDSVMLAEQRLAEFLEEHGARVYIVRLPSEPDGSKNGLDDFIVRHGREAFEDLVRDARPAQEPESARELRRQVSAIGQLMQNPKATAAQKVGTFAIATDAGWLDSKGEPGPYRVNYQRLARCGLSTDTLGSVLKWLDTEGVVEKKVTREATGELDEQGRPIWISIVELVPPEGGFWGIVSRAAAIQTERPKREYHPWRCPDHPEAEVIVRRVCSECGQLLEDDAADTGPGLDWQIANPEAEDEDEEQAPEALPIYVLNTPLVAVAESPPCDGCGASTDPQTEHGRSGWCDACAAQLMEDGP